MRHAYNGVAVDGNGRVITDATIAVFEANSLIAANIYTAISGGVAVNTVTSDSTNGSFVFFMDRVNYSSKQLVDITISKTGFQDITYSYLQVFPFEVDLDLREFLPYAFVTNGSVDYNTQQQAALDEIQSNSGGKLVYPQGIFATSLALDMPTVPLILTGFNYPSAIGSLGTGGTVIRQTGGAGIDCLDMVQAGSSNLSPTIIENIVLDGNGTAQHGINGKKQWYVTLRNARIYNFAGNGVNLDFESFYWRIDNFEIDNCDYGIYAKDTASPDVAAINGSVITRGYIHDITTQAIYVEDSGVFSLEDINCEKISDNVSLDGVIELNTCNQFKISKIHITDSVYGHGIIVDTCISGQINNVDGNMTAFDSLLYIDTSSHILISDIYSGLVDRVVYLIGSTFCDLSHVNPKDTTAQIYKLVTIDATSSGNSVIGCTAKGLTFASSVGLEILGDDNRLIGNHLEGCTVYGIFVSGDRNTVNGNIVKNNAGEGIYFLNADNNIATGNECYDDQGTKTQTYGIRTAGTANYNLIKANNCRDNKTLNVSVTGTNDEVQGNVGDDETVTTGSPTLQQWGSTSIDSSGGAITGTLGSGQYIGQVKTIVMTEASTSSTISISNHQTSDPEVATFNAVDETGVFMWTGTEWVTIFATCTFV